MGKQKPPRPRVGRHTTIFTSTKPSIQTCLQLLAVDFWSPMRFKKPVNFLPAGQVTSARFSDQPPPFLRHPPRKGRKRQGLIYQARAGAYLLDRYAPNFRFSPWVVFNGNRWCQPDGLLLLPERATVVVVEIKLSHCSEAWYQLFELYIPVVQVLFPGWEIIGCEVCKWYDPACSVQQNPTLRENPADAIKGAFNVHIYSP